MNLRALAALGLAAAIGLTGCGNDTNGTDASGSEPGGSGKTPSGASATDDTAMPPWPAPADVPAHVAAAGLDLGPMGMAEHYHPTLRIIIDGAQVPVPHNIGVDPTTGAMSALHTHEGDESTSKLIQSARCSPSASSSASGEWR